MDTERSDHQDSPHVSASPSLLTPVVVQGQGHGGLPATRALGLPRRIRPRRSIVLWTMAGLLHLTGAFWYWYRANHAEISYKTQVADRGPITAIVTATGAVNPVVSVQVGSQVSGKIAKLYADFNSVVREGQVIASIDQKPYIARVSQAKAALKNAQATLAKAKNMLAQRTREQRRMATLRQQQFVSQADLDLANTNYNDAAAQVDVAQARLCPRRNSISAKPPSIPR